MLTNIIWLQTRGRGRCEILLHSIPDQTCQANLILIPQERDKGNKVLMECTEPGDISQNGATSIYFRPESWVTALGYVCNLFGLGLGVGRHFYSRASLII